MKKFWVYPLVILLICIFFGQVAGAAEDVGMPYPGDEFGFQEDGRFYTYPEDGWVSNEKGRFLVYQGKVLAGFFDIGNACYRGYVHDYDYPSYSKCEGSAWGIGEIGMVFINSENNSSTYVMEPKAWGGKIIYLYTMEQITGWYCDPGSTATWYFKNDGIATDHFTIGGHEYVLRPMYDYVYMADSGRLIHGPGYFTEPEVTEWNEEVEKLYYLGYENYIIKGSYYREDLQVHSSQDGYDVKLFLKKENGQWKGTYFETLIWTDEGALTGAFERVPKGWFEANGVKYYFSEEGIAAIGFQTIGNETYYFDSYGRLVENSWVEENGNQYFMRKDSGTMVTGWQYIDGHWRYFRDSGTMVKSRWEWLGKQWKFFNYKGESIDQFRVENGKVWLSQPGPNTQYARGWKTVEGRTYFFRYSSGTRVSGWQYIDGGWKYFRPQGTQAFGWQYIGGNWYFLRLGSGNRVTGRQYIDGRWYHFRSNGTLIGNR